MSTQNDWEILFFRIFDQGRFPTLKGDYNDYIKFKADTTKIIEDFSTTLLADARKEVIDTVISFIDELTTPDHPQVHSIRG